MKIKHVTIEQSKNRHYTYIKIWTKIPDTYTLFGKFGLTDIEFLINAWNSKKENDIINFISKFNPSLCRGCITLLLSSYYPRKRFSWKIIGLRLYGIKTELNTPISRKRLLSTRLVPKNIENFIIKLDLPKKNSELLIYDLRDFIALWYLRKNEDKDL